MHVSRNELKGRSVHRWTDVSSYRSSGRTAVRVSSHSALVRFERDAERDERRGRPERADPKMASLRSQPLAAARNSSISSTRLRLPSHANHQRFKSPEGHASPYDERFLRSPWRHRDAATSRAKRASGPAGTHALGSALSYEPTVASGDEPARCFCSPPRRLLTVTISSLTRCSRMHGNVARRAATGASDAAASLDVMPGRFRADSVARRALRIYALALLEWHSR
jgi:hypothetical protein